LGTFVLIAFGDGVVAMAVAALNQSGRGELIFDASGDWLLIAWGWAFAVTFGVYVAGGISGAHINPTVTLAFAAKRGFPWKKVPGNIEAGRELCTQAHQYATTRYGGRYFDNRVLEVVDRARVIGLFFRNLQRDFGATMCVTPPRWNAVSRSSGMRDRSPRTIPRTTAASRGLRP
jgi:hypothetical protein